MIVVCTDGAVMHDMTVVNSVKRTTQRVVFVPPADRLVNAVRLTWVERRDRPWLALVAVPLAMNASGLTQLWWLWIPLLAGAAACTPAWRWSWVLGFQLGVVGTEWAYVGATSLAQWPTQRPLVGAIWAGVVLYLAGGASLHRQYRDLRQRRLRF